MGGQLNLGLDKCIEVVAQELDITSV